MTDPRAYVFMNGIGTGLVAGGFATFVPPNPARPALFLMFVGVLLLSIGVVTELCR